MTRDRAGSRWARVTRILLFGLGGLSALAAADPPAPPDWQELAPGLDTATFEGDGQTFSKGATIAILRADPERWEPALLCADLVNAGRPLTAREWCEAHDLHAATNAGMFAKDGRTHVGYLRVGEYTNSSHINGYQSVLAFSPKQPDLPFARLFDLDATTLEEILAAYHSVAQNLRLVQRPGVNRWSPQERMWSEAALGQDRKGRLLFIFAEDPFSMYEFNRILLALPIDLECAQHLEGGPEAQLFIRCGPYEREFIGSYETGFAETRASAQAWPIPNALGIRPRSARNP
jgi:hypothetical protein